MLLINLLIDKSIFSPVNADTSLNNIECDLAYSMPSISDTFLRDSKSFLFPSNKILLHNDLDVLSITSLCKRSMSRNDSLFETIIYKIKIL